MRAPEPARFPDGWAPDTAAFKAGLDLSTTDFTDQDRTALNDWYMRNGGEIPKWVTFMGKHRPEFLKGPSACAGRASSAARCPSSACR